MSEKAYNATVAARARAAGQILETPDLLSKFEEQGGLSRDLIGIRDSGLSAEAAHLGQSMTKSAGSGAVDKVWLEFAALQKEYKSVMGVVHAVHGEAARDGASTDFLAKLAGILADETQVTVSVVEEKDAEGNSEKKKKVKKSEAQEAIRAEIAKDAGALIGFTDAHERLTERRVTVDRLGALKQSADGLAGLLAERESAKGEGKSSTKNAHEAVALQSRIWQGTYRIFAALGRKDERVRALLKDAAK